MTQVPAARCWHFLEKDGMAMVMEYPVVDRDRSPVVLTKYMDFDQTRSSGARKTV